MEIWTAFILGFVGSVHCAGMCGPLAVALPASGGWTRRFVTGRLTYNGGRMLTYACLGIIFGLVGKTLLLAGIQRWASITIGVALLAGLLVSGRVAVWRPATALVQRLKSAMASLIRSQTPGSLALLGGLNGLLPCGLVYVACAAAAMTDGLVSGALYMAAFGLGTVPMMLALGLSGRLVPISLRLKLRKAIPVCVFLLATLLVLRGMSLGIPYLSPDLTAKGDACCSSK
jgi:sulfite exporter TauE/SafE